MDALLRPAQLQQRFALLDLATMDEAAMAAMPVSAIAGLALRFMQFLRALPPAQAVAAIGNWRRLVNDVLLRPRGKAVLMALFSWFLSRTPAATPQLHELMTTIEPEDPTMRSFLDELLEMGEKRGLERGRVEGRVEGRVDGYREVVRDLLIARFGHLPPAWPERLAAAKTDELRRWAARIALVAHPDELLRDD